MQASTLSCTAAPLDLFFLPAAAGVPVAYPDQCRALAHDANNLLGALRLYADLLWRPGVLQPQHRHYADELRSLSERSSSLLGQFAAQTNTASIRTIDAENAGWTAEFGRFAPLLARLVEPHATFRLRLGSRLPAHLPVPTESLERILTNLVTNASQCLQVQAHGLVEVTLHATRRRLRLTVADNGPGLPATTAMRLAVGQFPEGPRGQGHRIVHELIRASGGALQIRVETGRGTTFVIDWKLDAELSSAPLRRVHQKAEAICA